MKKIIVHQSTCIFMIFRAFFGKVFRALVFLITCFKSALGKHTPNVVIIQEITHLFEETCVTWLSHC